MLFTNANIITMNPAREIITNGALLVEGNRIKALEADKIFLQEKYGLSPVYFAESVGLLGPKSVLGHMVWPNDQDIVKLAETRTNVSHNPSSNSKLASGVCKVPSPNPISTLVYAATGGEVDTVVVDGPIVVEQGQLLTMDEEEIMHDAQSHANALYKRGH